MRTSCSRRIVRRAALALAGIVLLLLGYVASVAALITSAEAGIVPTVILESRIQLVYFAPLQCYMRAELPGSEAIAALMVWSLKTGASMRDR